MIDQSGKIIATGTYSAHSTIAVRVLDWSEQIIDENWVYDKLSLAHERRQLLGYGPHTETTGYRVLFGEADGFPGLVVDRYSDVVVLQISTAGIEALRTEIVACLRKLFDPSAIVERSDLVTRKIERMGESTGVIFGNFDETSRFLEGGLTFESDVLNGQKTGFYLDQKDLRKFVRQVSQSRRVLNLFAYTGSLGIAALAGGATSVLNIDSSASALQKCGKHAAMNGFEQEKMQMVESDVFQWLSTQNNQLFDMVMMDPPAIIKARKDIKSGAKAYHFLNRAALRLVAKGGVFVTSSCSQFFSLNELMETVARAATQNGRQVHILRVIFQSADHPLSVYFPESLYLKSLVLKVDS